MFTHISLSFFNPYYDNAVHRHFLCYYVHNMYVSFKLSDGPSAANKESLKSKVYCKFLL